MRRLLVTSLAAACLGLAACGGDDEPAATASTAADPPAASTAPAPAADAPTASTAPAPAADGTAVQVGMKGLQFDPADVTVKAGTTVTWTNNEDIPHNVVAQDGADFESDTFGKGGTYAFKAEAPGVVKYVCTIHPGMAGTITVEG